MMEGMSPDEIIEWLVANDIQNTPPEKTIWNSGF